MKKTKPNNMLIHGFILVTILATAKSAEAEITMEAAFQGHCGHTSPCEQLCYEIHDGMYECDCIEGYELNKNGYSCQVINATSNGDGHSSKSDEDVLYQKGASFSAKLANGNEHDNQLSSSYSSSSLSSAAGGGSASSSSSSSLEDTNEDDTDADDVANYFADDMQRLAQQRSPVNSQDYYISAESISFTNNAPEQQQQEQEQQELTNTSQDVPEFSVNAHAMADAAQAQAPAPAGNSQHKTIRINLKTPQHNAAALTATTTTAHSPMAIKSTSSGGGGSGGAAQPQTIMLALSANNGEEAPAAVAYGAYGKQDMSVYDDVNNNQLNLRPLSQSTYQNQYAAIAADAKPMSISKTDNQINENNHNQVNNATNGAIIANDNISNVSGGGGAGGHTASDFCNLDCGTEGVCDSSEGTARCLCPFGKSGGSCMEDIKVRTPKFSKRSWLAFPALRGAYKHVQVRVEFRPEAFDGIILLSGERDDLTGDFMALLLNKGFVEFWFDCGSGVGSVRSRETILLNEWNSVIIYRHRWDAWLVLNHGTKVQGRSNGLFSRITFREPVFLGGTGNITGLTKRLPVNNGFIGCIRRFVANEHEYRFEEHPLGDVTKGFDIQDCVTDKCFKYPCQHGGKCLPSDQGAVCLCPIGFVGDLCEIRMDLQVPAFNGSSYLRYAPLGDNALIWLELKVILKPEQADGLILYSGPEKHGDFIALSLSGGFVEFVFDLGSGPAVVRSEYPLSVGQWHTIKVSRTARLAVLKIDQYPEVMTISSNGFWHLSLPASFFIGGVNHVDKLPLDLKSKPFFMGCIQKIDINGHSLSIISEALGGSNIGNCPHACVARPCGPLAECVPQMENYECRCNAYNAQCNQAAVVPLEELAKNKAKKNKHGMYAVELPPQGEFKKGKKDKRKQMAHKQAKWHNGKEQQGWHKIVHSSSMRPTSSTTTTTTTTTTSTTMAPVPDDSSSSSEENEEDVMQFMGEEDEKSEPKLQQQEVNIEDDIIFRDVHGMHKKYGHNEQAQRKHKNNKNNNNKKHEHNKSKFTTQQQQQRMVLAPSTQHKNTHKQRAEKPQPVAPRKSPIIDSPLPIYAGEKVDPYSKPNGYTKFKLSSLPTHYESFQTNPDSDILTFDDNIEVDMGAEDEGFGDYKNEQYAQSEELDNGDQDEDDYNQPAQSNYEKYQELFSESLERDAHDAMNEQRKSEPNTMDETLFDAADGSEDYHRKQLTQDMQRILANAPVKGDERGEQLAQPQLVVDEYDYEADDSQDEDKSSVSSAEMDTPSPYAFDNANEDDDDLLEPVHTVPQSSVTKPKLSTTPQTHTDWSLLKKLELSADHQSQFAGVRKNFGACFAGEDSYFHYNDADTMSQIISYNIDLNLRIKTHSQNGVILWTGRQGTTEEDDDYLSLGIENGFLHFRYDLGSGEVDIKFNATKVSDGLWHRVRAIRDSQAGYLEVDGRKTSIHHSPGKLRQLNTDTGLYVGGMPDVSYFTRRKYATGIVGCISEIVLAGELKLNFDPNTLGTAHNVETGLL